MEFVIQIGAGFCKDQRSPAGAAEAEGVWGVAVVWKIDGVRETNFPDGVGAEPNKITIESVRLNELGTLGQMDRAKALEPRIVGVISGKSAKAGNAADCGIFKYFKQFGKRAGVRKAVVIQPKDKWRVCGQGEVHAHANSPTPVKRAGAIQTDNFGKMSCKSGRRAVRGSVIDDNHILKGNRRILSEVLKKLEQRAAGVAYRYDDFELPPHSEMQQFEPERTFKSRAKRSGRVKKYFQRGNFLILCAASDFILTRPIGMESKII